MSKHLDLTVADLLPAYRDKPPEKPRFFHFHRKALEFQEAETIVFKCSGRPDYVIKDTYGTLSK